MDNQVARLRADTDTVEKAKVVDNETLIELREIKEGALFATSQAQEADSKFRASLARTYRQLGVPIETSVLCLNCGMVRHASVNQCPRCSR